MGFNEIIKKELLKQNKQQKDLAKYIGIPTATVHSWTKGSNPKVEHLIKIAEFLNVSLDYLLTGEKQNTVQEETTELVELFKELEIEKQIKALSSVIKIK